jgi:hypothetical protein
MRVVLLRQLLVAFLVLRRDVRLARRRVERDGAVVVLPVALKASSSSFNGGVHVRWRDVALVDGTS